jgi:hypothetical protein
MTLRISALAGPATAALTVGALVLGAPGTAPYGEARTRMVAHASAAVTAKAPNTAAPRAAVSPAPALVTGAGTQHRQGVFGWD